MRLNELYAGTPTPKSYTDYLKKKGYYKQPNLKGKNGYVLKNFHPEEDEVAYKTHADAKKAAPKERDHHWLIFAVSSGEPVDCPDWVEGDSHLDWQHKQGS